MLFTVKFGLKNEWHYYLFASSKLSLSKVFDFYWITAKKLNDDISEKDRQNRF